MKKKCLLFFVSLLVLFCTMISCSKETTVYGVVVDKKGEPKANMQVSLMEAYFTNNPTSSHSIASSVTGSDGQYEIIFSTEFDPEQPNYWICLKKNNSSEQYYSINIRRGKMNRYDLVWDGY